MLAGSSSYENISPQILSRLGREINAFVRNAPEGIRYIENPNDGESSLAEIHAEIDGPEQTPYFGGTFRLKLVLGSDYPNSPPRGFFLTKIFHPNISENGDICVNTLKRDWSADVTISRIFQVIRCLLIVPFPESSLNDEAGKFFMESYDEYARRAALWTRLHAQSSSSSMPDSSAAIAQDESKGACEDSKSSDLKPSAKSKSKSKSKQKDSRKKGLKRL
eukprot:CAMPEP_0113935596 /NCGR_PEP_ID=MMETSP1339-20121228/2725_1 /TAXON_ID=94617 /ORGANISM="Fibrocapsa japonica" /LENGTH=219 /DNA_ID=CAMNT_0000937809 /DNA_START=111 /DNA_END=770 /DNA_ORIENTATION=+ /assembly_acc=CAM_ASM_000762